MSAPGETVAEIVTDDQIWNRAMNRGKRLREQEVELQRWIDLCEERRITMEYLARRVADLTKENRELRRGAGR